ncbi:MAG TPA: type II toxin-antitoxin system RelE/ParE family toxin [Gemmatimonadaceae bacterium]|nr:type II toxin-antitoxin system RelE/ParE family toxin [Gemmatimonadaceae bacterium]
MKVVWAEHARNRLADIYRYIERDSPSRAADFCERLIEATEQLANHPFSGPLLPEDGAYRLLIVDEYRIVYRVADKIAYVMTIVAPGMLYEQSL